jgi:hypothetical protein
MNVLYDRYDWVMVARGAEQTITSNNITRTRYHDCQLPQAPRWVWNQTADRRLFGLLPKKVKYIDNPHDLQDRDKWTCPDCRAVWMCIGIWRGTRGD